MDRTSSTTVMTTYMEYLFAIAYLDRAIQGMMEIDTAMASHLIKSLYDLNGIRDEIEKKVNKYCGPEGDSAERIRERIFKKD